MSRVTGKPGTKGSLKWIQRAVGERWPSLDDPILARINLVRKALPAREIKWLSPLAADGYAEYRDEEFLRKLGVEHLAADLREFWPARGPQWDALGRPDRGDLRLIEAKSHVAEMSSTGTAEAAPSSGRSPATPS